MKLKIQKVGTIPKKLVLLSITIMLGLVVLFGLNTKVFASNSAKVTFDDDVQGESYVASSGEYRLTRNAGAYEYDLKKRLGPGSYETLFTYSEDAILDMKIIIETGNVTFDDDVQGESYVASSGEYRLTRNAGAYEYDLKKRLGPGSYKTLFTYSEDAILDMKIIIDDEIDGYSPVISGETTFVSNVADPKDAAYFMQFLSAYDETDGDVSDSLKIIADNYTANKSKLGNHTFTVEASDKSGNKTTAIINVRVVDIDKPVITGNTTVATIGYKETYNIENFRKTLTVTDNYDQMTNADIKIKTDGYTTNKTKLGTYNVVFYAKDSSGNEGIFTKSIKVIDNVKPTFSGPSVISTSNNTILTETEIRAQITAHDDIDGNITNRIELVEDNYTGNGNKVGSYTIKYSVKDNANNIDYYIVTIQRTDKIPPTIWVEDGVSIRTNIDTPISYQIIIDILQETGQITVNASTTFSFPLDEYTGNEQEPGIYAMSVKARSTNGNESIFNMSIVVYDTEDDGGIDVNPDFDLGIWFKDNYVYVIVGAVALLGVGFLVYKTKRRKRR